MFEKLITIPPVSERKFIKPLAWVLHPNLNPENDEHYLFYKFYIVAFSLSLIVFLICLIDVITNSFVIINQQAYTENIFSIFQFVLNVTNIIIILILPVFYLRVRTNINLKEDTVFIFLRKKNIIGNSKFKIIIKASSAFFIMFALLLGAYDVTEWFCRYLGIQDSLLYISVIQVIVLMALTGWCSMLISSTVFIEKVIRFYPQAQQDIELMQNDFF